jgi:hypothetical protein
LPIRWEHAGYAGQEDAMQDENVLIMNEAEKEIAKELIRKISAGTIPAKEQNEKLLLNYECYSTKQETIIRGVLLGCPYKLRHKDSGHVFFSAWNCKDVCSVFYDLVMCIYALNEHEDVHLLELAKPFDVDVRTERYVFLAGDLSASFVSFVDCVSKNPRKANHSSQYVLSIFNESDDCVYAELIQGFKKDGYSKIQILQIWIRGEIFYYAIADGAVLRPERQRILTAKEEEDLVRKIYKNVNGIYRTVDLSAPA